MPYFNSDLPLLKTTELTKQLRARDRQSLLSLLDLAEEVFHGAGTITESGVGIGRKNVYFPKKEEWLLEWAVQRLKEEEGSQGVEARLCGRFWKFILRLLEATERGVAARCLRKHGFLGLVGMVMDEAGKEQWPRVKVDAEGDVGMLQEEEVESSVTEAGSPMDEQHPTKRRRILNRAMKGTEKNLNAFLGDVVAVVKFLQQDAAGSMIPVLRGTPELGAQILGGYLTNLRKAMESLSKVEEIRAAVKRTETMVGIWRGCIYGSGDIKKISSLFSKACLRPLFEILAMDIAESSYALSLEILVAEYIFAPALLTGPATLSKGKSTRVKWASEAVESELKALLTPLQGMRSSIRADAVKTGMEKMLQIGISKTVQSTGRLSRIETVEAIFYSLLHVVLNLNLHGELPPTDSVFPEEDANTLSSLLRIIHESGVYISDDTLRKIVTLAANLPQEQIRLSQTGRAEKVRWTIIDLALTLDFDTFILSKSTSLLDRLVSALSDAWVCLQSLAQTRQQSQKEALIRIILLLLNGFLKARDLDGFLAFWSNELNAQYKIGGEEVVLSSIWTNESVVTMFARILESGYSAAKIEKVASSYLDAIRNSGALGKTAIADIFLLDTLLRGVRREETQERLKTTGTIGRIFDTVADGILAKDINYPALLGRQVLYRVVQIDEGLLQTEKAKNVVREAVAMVAKIKVIDSEVSSANLGESLLCMELLFHNSECTRVECQEAYDFVDIVLRDAISSLGGAKLERWDGPVLCSLKSSNISTAVLYAIVKRWLRVIADFEAKYSSGRFIDDFFVLALDPASTFNAVGVSPRDVWEEMLNCDEFYELPLLKDQVLDALMAGGKLTSHKSEWYSFFLDTISKYPLEAIRRDKRERIVNLVYSQELWVVPRLRESPLEAVLDRKERALIARLMNLPSAGYNLISDPKKLVTWFESVDMEKPDTRNATLAVGEKVIRRAMQHIDQSQNVEYLRGLLEAVYTNIKKGNQISSSWALGLLCLRECWNCSREIKTELEKLRAKILDLTAAWLEKTSDPGLTARLLSFYGEALFLNTEEREDTIKQAEEICSKSLEQWLPSWNTMSSIPSPPEGQEQLRNVLASLVGLRCQCPQTPDTITPTIAFIILALEYTTNHPQKEAILRSYTLMISNLTHETYLTTIASISDACFHISQDINEDYYTLLRLLLKSTKKPDSTTPETIHTAIHDSIAKTYSSLALSLPKCSTHTSFITLLDCMTIIVKDLPWGIIQFNIDETLSCLTICTSPSGAGPSFILPSTVHPDTIYLPITRLLLSILLGHRLRLKGRYHLLIALLQSLLRCLFTFKPGMRKKSDLPIHPAWLSPETPLTKASAQGYTRVLTTLCDPPTSTVSAKKSSSSSAITTSTSSHLLTSRTQLARKEVARYIPYVMMEYLHLQLNMNGGRLLLEKDVREGLTMGVYAMFEVMKAEDGTLKTLAAGLDAQGRVVFKRLWEEFGKFGVERA